MFASEAIKKTLELPNVGTILDIGCGKGEQALQFLNAGKHVIGIDFATPLKSVLEHPNFTHVQRAFPFGFPFQVDCVWLSHTLEHVLDIQAFLIACHRSLWLGGHIVVTVPPAKPEIVGGHVSLWNAGLLLYRLVLAGFDCSQAKVKRYGYNITVIAVKTWTYAEEVFERGLKFDNGDIETLKDLFPKGYDYQGFNGSIEELNWT